MKIEPFLIGSNIGTHQHDVLVIWTGFEIEVFTFILHISPFDRSSEGRRLQVVGRLSESRRHSSILNRHDSNGKIEADPLADEWSHYIACRPFSHCDTRAETLK